MKLSVGGGKEGVEEDGGVDVDVRRGKGRWVGSLLDLRLL